MARRRVVDDQKLDLEKMDAYILKQRGPLASNPDDEDAPTVKAVEKQAAMALVSKPYWVTVDAWTSPEITEPDEEYPIPNVRAHRHALHLKVNGTSREDASDQVNKVFQSLMDMTVKKWSEENK